MNKALVFAGVIAASLILHYGIYLHWKIDYQTQEIFLMEQGRKIQDDQIRDLVMASQQNDSRVESAKTEGYVAGTIDAINKKDHYNAIWHHGYDRGVAVQMEAEASNKLHQASQKKIKK